MYINNIKLILKKDGKIEKKICIFKKKKTITKDKKIRDS